MNDTIHLINVTTPEQIGTIRTLFLEYQQWLNVSLCFQGFDQELAGLPGAYAPPSGRLYLATIADAVAGCIALRAMDEDEVCEMKRLFVREEFRGMGIGRQLAERVVADARAAGYRRMRLDTLRRMEEARSLYRSLGFVEIAPYYHNPIEETAYMELMLSDQ